MNKIQAERYHDICAGHRVVGHEGKCRNLHGHNYRFHFTIEANELDSVGRVLDFSVIKSTLCEWLEEYWDHKMLLWENDPILEDLEKLNLDGIVQVPFNPTAENIANYFMKFIAPTLLNKKGAKLVRIKIEETRKCSVICEVEEPKRRPYESHAEFMKRINS